jgi:hypothetical protein
VLKRALDLHLLERPLPERAERVKLAAPRTGTCTISSVCTSSPVTA